MPSSEELQMAFSFHVDRDNPEVLEQESNFRKRVDELEGRFEGLKFDELAANIHVVNKDKGFWGDPEWMDKVVAKLMLVVTEVAEVTEALRKSQGKDKVTEEFADIFIRCLDVYKVLVDAGEADPLLLKVIKDKVETNRTRPAKHGNRWG